MPMTAALAASRGERDVVSELSGLSGAGRDTDQVSAELAAVLREMGAVVLASETVETIVELVIRSAVATIPGTTGAGVTLMDSRGARSLAASDSLVEQADAVQYELDAGPCLTSWRDRVTVRIDDLTTETRWPQWCAAAADLGVRAMLSVPLVTDGVSTGAIKVYSTVPDVYHERGEELLTLFAQQAAILLGNSQTLADARRLSSDLADALGNRDVIGQAKGALIAQGAPDEQAAFAMLVSASQRSQTKLHDVARQLMESVSARRAPRVED
jgi:GAF domain-containing protein